MNAARNIRRFACLSMILMVSPFLEKESKRLTLARPEAFYINVWNFYAHPTKLSRNFRPSKRRTFDIRNSAIIAARLIGPAGDVRPRARRLFRRY